MSFIAVATRRGRPAIALVNGSGVKFIQPSGNHEDGVPQIPEPLVVQLEELLVAGSRVLSPFFASDHGGEVPRCGVVEQRFKFSRQFAHRVASWFGRNRRMIAGPDWQCCPVCLGHGVVPHGFHTYPAGQSFGATSTAPEKCQRCEGTGTIVRPQVAA